MANIVSIIGIDRAIIGTSNVIEVIPLNSAFPIIEIAAILNPRKRLPVSPIKILAGKKLYFRKARLDPIKIIEEKVMIGLFFKRPTANNTNATIKAIPEANPSIPSIRLNALTTSKNHKTVIKGPAR